MQWIVRIPILCVAINLTTTEPAFCCIANINESLDSNIAGQPQVNWSPAQASSRPGTSSPCKVFWSTLIMKFMLNFIKSNYLLFPFSLNRTERYILHSNNNISIKENSLEYLLRAMCWWKRMKRMSIYTWNYKTLSASFIVLVMLVLEYKRIAHLSPSVKLLGWTGWCMQLNMVSKLEVSSSNPD